MTETTLTTTRTHGRRRAAASPFDEIARTGSDGQPYWSARDLAKLFGYSEWRKFTDSIRKAREQVAAHNIAGQPNNGDVAGNGGEHFVNTETVSRVGFGDRTIPDVHLTRFAAYFVALNADQSKPEVKAAVNYYFVGRTIQAETMVTAGAADPMLTAQTAERLAAMEATLAGLPEVLGEVVREALADSSEPEDFVNPAHVLEAYRRGQRNGAERARQDARVAETPAPDMGDPVPDDYTPARDWWRSVRGVDGRTGGEATDLLLREGYVRRTLRSKRRGGRAVYDYTVTPRGEGLVAAATKKSPYAPPRLVEAGVSLYLTPAGREWALEAFARKVIA